MNNLTIVITLGVLIFLSHAFKELFAKTKIPSVLLLMLIGIIAGPILGLITTDYFGGIGPAFTSITLIVILFESGVHLKINEIKKSIGLASLLTVANFIITVIVVTAIVKAFTDLNTLSATFIGAIIGGTSSAVVIPIVKQLKMGEKSTSVLILESAISDVLCLVIGLALLDGMIEGDMEIKMVFSKTWKSFLFAILIGVTGGFLWSGLILIIRSIENSMITTLAFVFILYGIVELFKFNGGLAVLTFGIVLGNNELINQSKLFNKIFIFKTSGFNENEQHFFSEIVFVMQTFFFVYIGISLKFSSLGIFLTAFLIVLLIIAFRVLNIRVLGRKGISKAERNIMSVLSPKGLVTAVLASVPFQMGIEHGEKIQDLGYAIVLISIVISSILVIILSINPDFFGKIKDKRRKKPASDTEKIISEEENKSFEEPLASEFPQEIPNKNTSSMDNSSPENL